MTDHPLSAPIDRALRKRSFRVNLVEDILAEITAEFGPITVERDDRQVCMRCEVPIFQDDDGKWRRREATGSDVCPRNPARDGHEPRPRAFRIRSEWRGRAVSAQVTLTEAEREAIDFCPDCGSDAYRHNDLGRTITPSTCARTVVEARQAAVEQIVAARLAERGRRVEARALRDAAAEWSDWDALEAPEAWLRDRADRIERGETDE